MKVLGHLSVSKRINTNHPWFHLAIFGLSFQMYFDGIISKREAKKCLVERKSWTLKWKVCITFHWSDCGEWQLSSVCLVIYPVHMSSPSHWWGLTTSQLSQHCHTSVTRPVLCVTLGTLASVFSVHLAAAEINKSVSVNILTLGLNKSRHCHMIVSHIKSFKIRIKCVMTRKTFPIFAQSCDGGDGSWAGYLHAGLMFLFTGLKLQSCRGMPPVDWGGMVPMRANRGSYIYKGQ